MTSNAIGTIFRAFIILASLIFIWFISISVVYLIICFIFDLKFTIFYNLIIFSSIVIVRMFYPKNVFI